MAIRLPWWLNSQRIRLQCRRPQFDSWVGKICWRRDTLPTPVFLGFPCGSASKESACSVGDLSLIPGLGKSPGEGNGYPLQYSSILAWRIPWTIQSPRVGHDWAIVTSLRVHWVRDAIQPSHPLFLSFPASYLSQHQSLFQWVGSSGGQSIGASAYHQSFQSVFRIDFL